MVSVQLKSKGRNMLDGDSYSSRALQLARQGDHQCQYYREITCEALLEPGSYVIVPSTFKAFEERHFLLRCYTERDADAE